MNKKTLQKCVWVLMLTLLVGIVPTNTYGRVLSIQVKAGESAILCK